MQKIIGFVAVSLFAFSSITIQSQNNSAFASSSSTIPPNPKCNIKGNISVNTGKKIYHIPGQQDYEKTVISPDKGERWFCSEQEAKNAGWTKAPK